MHRVCNDFSWLTRITLSYPSMLSTCSLLTNTTSDREKFWGNHGKQIIANSVTDKGANARGEIFILATTNWFIGGYAGITEDTAKTEQAYHHGVCFAFFTSVGTGSVKLLGVFTVKFIQPNVHKVTGKNAVTFTYGFGVTSFL